MKRIAITIAVATLSLFVVGFAFIPEDSTLLATTDSTAVTLDPNMPDDFLNLYPDLTEDDLVGYPDLNEDDQVVLPDTGVSLASIAAIGLLLAGVLAVGVAVAMAVPRPRRTKSSD